MRRAVATMLVVMILAGCADETPADVATLDPESSPLVDDCTTPGFQAREGSVCTRWIRADDRTHYEPHLAAHPTDPARVLVASMLSQGGDDLAPSTVHVIAATTDDAGTTWASRSMHDSGLDEGRADEAPLLYDYAFDAVTRFAPGGDALVHFAAYSAYRHPVSTGPLEDGDRQVVHGQMTLARSADDGTSWSYDAYHESPVLLELDDYMDFEVYGDGALFAVTDSHGEGLEDESLTETAWPFVVALWRSMDDGATWQQSTLASAPSREEREVHFPRLAVGADGLVVVTAPRFDGSGQTHEGVSAWVSRDGGGTFTGPTRVSELPNTSSSGQQPVAWGQRIDVVHGTSDQRVVVVRSTDAGMTWQAPFELAAAVPGRDVLVWEATVDDRSGTLYVLAKGAAADGTGFFLDLLRWDGAQVDRVPLMARADVGDGGVFEGGHYAGLDVAADGAVWVAWADPREDADPIAVARLLSA